MNFKLTSVIAFVICQVCLILAQQQGHGPTQAFPFIPGDWANPLHAAAAEAWREYFIQAGQATNQLYQQWANMSGNPLSNAMGGLGGLYGIGNLGQSDSDSRLPGPLLGIFDQAPKSRTRHQLRKLLPDDGDANVQAPTQDPVPAQRSRADAQQQSAIVGSQTRARPRTLNQPKLSQIDQSPAQQVTPVQPQIVPPREVSPMQPHGQQQTIALFQIPGRPFQTLAQAANSVGLFGPSSPFSWIG